MTRSRSRCRSRLLVLGRCCCEPCIGLGRTPLPPHAGEPVTALELINPKEKRKLRITLRFAR